MGLQVHFAILHCDATDDATEDECILEFNGHQFWRGIMKGGRARNTDFFAVFPHGQTEALVSLTDEDWPTNDHLGSHAIRRDEEGQGWHRAHFGSEDARYHLDYEVFNAA
jgi:hypothetical protein